MLQRILVLRQEGQVNRTYGVMPVLNEKYWDDGLTAEAEEGLKKLLRKDRDRNSPAMDPSEVKYFYLPTMARQELYRLGFPIQVGINGSEPVSEIIDAFSCNGVRFGLSDLMVFVELYRSKMGDRSYWAYVYYVASPMVPALTIWVEAHILDIPDEFLRTLLAAESEVAKA